MILSIIRSWFHRLFHRPLTHKQMRAAFLRAADRIEQNPGCYNFFSGLSPARNATPDARACMWGWAGYEAGLYNTLNYDVAEAFGIAAGGDLYRFRQLHDYHNPESAAALMRAFANHHWPE